MRDLRVGALLSCDSFERFFTDQLGLDRDTYAAEYRNDWSWEYARQLRREGVQLTLLLPSFGPDQRVVTEDGYQLRWLAMRPWVRVYERFPVLARTPPARWLAQVLYTAVLVGSLRAALRDDGIDVLYVQEYWTGRFDVLALARFGGVPVVGADHGGRSYHQFTALKRAAFSRAAALTAQNRSEADDVQRFGATARVLGNGVDTDYFTPGPRAEDSPRPRLLHVARLVEAHKRTSLVIRALLHLPDEVVLDVAGSGPDENRLRELVDRLGLRDRVVFHGFVGDRDALRSLYRAADVLVQPSSHEARLLAALEAMSCGTPVVLTDIPAFRDVLVDERGGRITAAEPRAIAAAVQSALHAGDALRDEARRTVLDHHSWTVRRRELAELLTRASRSA